MERSDFTKGAYNPNDHNHTEWSDDRLSGRVQEITEDMKNITYTGERLQQLQHELMLVTMEQVARYYESHGESVAEGWRDIYGK